MPKKTNRLVVRTFVSIMVFTGLAAAGAVLYLWWQARQVDFVMYQEFGIPIPADYTIHGIDVSHYQHLIAWDAVQHMEVNYIRLGFAFIKATEGVRNVDPFFKRNWRKSRESGITRGAYHFFIVSRDAKVQAKHFIENVSLESGDLPPVLDVEKTFGQPSVQIRKKVKEWLDVVEEYYKVKPIIYTNADFYKVHLQGYFEDYPLWVAHYLQPHQPRISRSWSFWQHSEQGRVNGIRPKVDFNVFNGDSTAFRALLVP